MTTPASWSVQWAQAETQVTVCGTIPTVTISPSGPLAATVTVTDAAGGTVATLNPDPGEVIYPSPPAVIQPPD